MALAISHSEIYPGYIAMLLKGGKGAGRDLCVATSKECVNISAGVGHTKGPKGRWVGMQLYVMCPNDETARIVIPAIATLVRSCDQDVVSQAIMDQLVLALRHSEEDVLQDGEIWAGDLPLVR